MAEAAKVKAEEQATKTTDLSVAKIAQLEDKLAVAEAKIAQFEKDLAAAEAAKVKAEEQVESYKSGKADNGVSQKAVRESYDEGLSYTQLAYKFYGFDSEEAIAKIRTILEK